MANRYEKYRAQIAAFNAENPRFALVHNQLNSKFQYTDREFVLYFRTGKEGIGRHYLSRYSSMEAVAAAVVRYSAVAA